MVASSLECMNGGVAVGSKGRRVKAAVGIDEDAICGSEVSATGRRTSSRLQKLRNDGGREVCYNEQHLLRAKPVVSESAGKVSRKRKASGSVDGGRRKSPVENKDLEVAKKVLGTEEGALELKSVAGGGLMSLGLQVEFVSEGQSSANVVKSASLKVKETLRAFNTHYLHFIQEEELRCSALQKIDKGSKKKDGERKKVPHKRPDLKAVSKMMEMSAILYPIKQFGAIPGVEVGHQFFSRAEMVAVGFHSHWLNGIDFMGKSYCRGEYSDYTFPVAVAIVMSGQYEDDVDNSDEVVYTGQGGNNLLGDKRQVRDQVMERGNLALKNSMDQGLPVRVIRGHISKNSYVGRVYTYDGLYKVVHNWAEKGVSGFTVYKYRMKRLAGQPELMTNQAKSVLCTCGFFVVPLGFKGLNPAGSALPVQYVRGRVPKSAAEVKGLVCEDISGGQEDIPIPATNLVDEEPLAPTGFKYCKSLQVAANVKIPGPTFGCACKGMCVNPRTCDCARLNGGDFPYVQRDGGRLIEAKAIVFECGPKCGCGPGCVNRMSQRGIRYRLEVFRTPKKGWGVRSWDCIPAGAPICEYVGVLKRSDEAESVAESNYVFDIDCLQTMKGLDGRERRFRDVSMPTGSIDKADDKITDSAPEFCIDAGSTGNVARFINHCCEPNLFVQCILSSHHDVKLAKVMLFAADNIPPLQELTYDYGYALDSVLGPDGKVKKMTCYCGAAGCRKRLF